MIHHFLTKVLLVTLLIQQVFGSFWVVNVDKQPTVNNETWMTFHYFDLSAYRISRFGLKPICEFNKMFKTNVASEQDDYNTCGKNHPSVAAVGFENHLTGLKVLDSDIVYPCEITNFDATKFDTYICGEWVPNKYE